MTSTTLKSKNTFIPAFKKTAKKGLGGMIAAAVIAVIVPIFALAVSFYNNIYMIRYEMEYDATIGAIVVLGIMTVTCAAFSLFTCPKLFKEIYKKQSCDLYFSLPIKRENYFFASYLFGALVNVIALILPTIIYSSLILAMSTRYVTVIIDFNVLFRMLIPIVIAMLTAYTSFIMCAVISGRRIHYYLLALVCVYATSSGVSGIVTTLNSIWGFSIKSAFPLCVDPYMNAAYSVMTESLGMRILACAIMVAEIIAMLAAGVLIFKKRRAEVAEVTLAGRVVPYILLALLVLAGFMRYCGYTPIFHIIAGCILAVLLSMAFTGIFYKKVFTKQSGITVGAICIACTLLVGTVNLPLYSGYVKKLPQASEVESIEISNNSSDDMFSSAVFDIIEMFSYDIDENGYSPNVEIKSEEGIAAAIKLHEKLIDDNVIKSSKNYSYTALVSVLFNPDELFEGNYAMLYDIELTYHLKSGKTITRTYNVDGKLILDEYYELAKSDEMLSSLSSLDFAEDDILSLNVYETDYYDYDLDSEIAGTTDLDNMEEEENYVDEYVDAKHWTNIKGALINDLKGMEKAKFLERFNELNAYYGITSTDYYNEATQCVCINILSLSKDTPEDIAKELKSMSSDQLYSGYSNHMYSDVDYAFVNGDSVDKNSVSKFAYIEESDIHIYTDEAQTLDYFRSIGLNF